MFTILLIIIAAVLLLNAWALVGLVAVAIRCGDRGILALSRWTLVLGGPLVWLVWTVERRRP